MDSYVKSFDYMCLVSINGQVLHVNQGEMMDDPVTKDVVRLGVGPVLSCREFREKAKAEADADSLADTKQAVANSIMEELEKMHVVGEEIRKRYL